MDASMDARTPADLRVVAVAEAVATPQRVRILLALEPVEEMSASDLAHSLGLSPANASNHLARLLAVGVVDERRVGRHRFLRLAKPEIVKVLRSVAGVAGLPPAPPKTRSSGTASGFPVAEPLARTCYGRLAGGLGVALTDHLLKRRWIAWKDAAHAEVSLTVSGTR